MSGQSLVQATTVALAMLAGATPAAAAEAPPPGEADPLARLVDQHRYVVQEKDGRLAGPGFEFLVREGAASEFFLVGESHNKTEIPRLTQELALALRGAGYGAFAVEIGPHTARALVARLRQGGVEAQRRWVAEYPFTLPFFDRRPEVEMLQATLAAGYEVWGLDQEFIGSGRWFLDRLAGLAPGDEARAAVAELQERERAAVGHFLETESTEQALLSRATPEEFRRLRSLFAGRDEALAIIDALATSARIYQLWRTDNYENNRQRVDYLKGNLVANLDTWERRTGSPARVLIKAGSVHTVRGRTITNQFDLGNLALQLAVQRGGQSFHLWTVALGMRNEDGSFESWLSEEPGWQLLAARVDPAQPWTVFDLRPLRGWFHRESNRQGNDDLAETVFQHDALVVAPELRRGEPLVDEGP